MILERLRNPRTIMSLVAQIIAVLVLLGVKIDEQVIMAVAAGGCSILATLGILIHPDKKNEPWDVILICTASGEAEPHVAVNGQMVCKNCGAVYKDPDAASTEGESV